MSRKAAQADSLRGGFGPVYKVCRELEEQGRVRRGYFVDGLEGAQFGYAGAIDRLRESRENAEDRDTSVSHDEIVTLSAMDPANPFGALVPWPDVADAKKARPRRVAGSWLLIARGRPVLYVGRRGRALITFPATLRDEQRALDAAIAALRDLPKGGRHRMLVIETIDGVDAKDSPLVSHFHAAGFSSDYRGLIDVTLPGTNRAHGGGA